MGPAARLSPRSGPAEHEKAVVGGYPYPGQWIGGGLKNKAQERYNVINSIQRRAFLNRRLGRLVMAVPLTAQ